MDTVIAVDFETYYGDDLSVKRQGPVVYASLTDIFMVGIFTPGLQYVGPPQDAPWHAIAGGHWVSHNAGFDQAVFRAAVQRGLISATPPVRWSCTADLSALLNEIKDAQICVIADAPFYFRRPKRRRQLPPPRHHRDD